MRNMSKKTWKLRVWNRMTEVQKLDCLLTKLKVPHTYDNFHIKSGVFDEQVVVYNVNGQRIWDGSCCPGSYGFRQGLIEVMGEELIGHNDTEGFLTARQVTKMWRCRNAAKNR